MAIWNLNNIYNFDKTEELISEFQNKINEFKEYKTKLDNLSVEDFLKILKLKEELSVISSKLSAYASLWLTENTSDKKRLAHENKISEMLTHSMNDILFFGLWFKNLGDEEVEKYITVSGKNEYYLRHSRNFKKYMLKENEEKIINLKDLSGSDVVCKLYDILTNKYQFEWEGKLISQEELRVHVRSHKREDRKKAYELLLNKYGEEEAALGEIYTALSIDLRNEDLLLRGFKSPISIRNLSNDIPDEAVEALLNVVRKNISVFHDYFELKGKMIGIKMDRYDLYAPLNDVDVKYSYDESKTLVLDTYNQFNKLMGEYAQKIFDDNHVHSEQTENKQSGAFCYHIHNSLSPYILLNHQDKLEDVFTMMHEFGHGIHGILSSKQTELTSHAALPLAETASIFGEMLLSQRLLKEKPELKKTILLRLLDSQYASITRQAYFTIFEKDAHDQIAKGASIDELNEIYLNNLKEQFGGSINVPDIFKHEWKYIPHIYHSAFYCYAYAFGNLLVLALYKMYETEGEDFVPKYLKILEYGGSKAPAEILKEVGVDISSEEFWQNGFDLIKEEINQLKEVF